MDYQELFSKVERSLPGGDVAWVREARAKAMARFAELGFPTEKDEAWRFTRAEPIARERFVLAPKPAVLSAADLSGLSLRLLDGVRLTFVDGFFVPELSELPKSPGLSAGNIAARLASGSGELEASVGASSANGAFAALNTGFFQDGALILLAPGTVLEKPVHLLFISTGKDAVSMTHPRILFSAGAGSSAKLVEEHVGIGEGTYFNNIVAELSLGDDSSVEHYKLQREGAAAFHVAATKVRQARNSRYASHSISLGASLSRHDLSVRLEGEGADCALNGLYLAGDRQHMDHHTVIEHAVPHGTSRELYKGVLDGHARAVFDGSIIVQPAAQKTDARVYNKNLLLSEHGLVNTKPEFKIHANDVQCKHGATVGQLSADALFYLRSRGLDLEAARRLLVSAFASEMVEKLELEPLKEALGEWLNARLPG